MPAQALETGDEESCRQTEEEGEEAASVQQGLMSQGAVSKAQQQQRGRWCLLTPTPKEKGKTRSQINALKCQVDTLCYAIMS